MERSSTTTQPTCWTGSAGLDWFLFNADGDGSTRDKATDLHAAEFAADLDWLTTEV